MYNIQVFIKRREDFGDKKRTKIIKIIIFIITIALLIGMTVYFYPIMKGLFSADGRGSF